MGNLKIRVKNEAESREAQELFLSIGLDDVGDCKGMPWIASDDSAFSGYTENTMSSFAIVKFKEITLPQLRDLVVLKRGDVRDATHKNSRTNKPYLVQGDEEYYMMDGVWIPSNCLDELIPIEKTMKEYLDPRNGYKLIEAPESEALEPHASEWILVPEGMNFAHKDKFNIHFTTMEMGYRDSIAVWQRHDLPEERPCIDDEKSLNDQYAEIEKVRQSKSHSHYFIDVSDVDEVDFYEIALRYNVTDPCIQHILKKCLAVGSRGHKDFQTDIRDIYDTAKRAIQIHGLD